MLDLSFDPVNRILWVKYATAVSAENLAHLDSAIAAFISREGVVDMVLDYSNAPPSLIDSSLIRTRAATYSVPPGQRRVLVAPSDHIFGMFRMYATYRDTAHPGTAPAVVRTLDDALAALQIDKSTFKPVKV
jgi:hypothetical protein